MIIFQNISKTYHVGGEEIHALNRANIHIYPEEFVSIIDPSGSGKSTMMNIMGCLDTPDEGQYILDGQPTLHCTGRDLARIRSRKIGFIFQSFNLIGNMSAEENVELPLIYQKLSARERKERVKDSLDKVGLYKRRGHKPSQLSGGQQQRVAIARAMAQDPSLYLADEPTGNLDSNTGYQIMNLFHELHERGNTIVLITHDESVAAQAGRSIRMKDGHAKEVTP